MNDERGLLGQSVHQIDCLREGRVDIRIGVFVEADVGIADLHEERLPQPGAGELFGGGQCQVDRREHATSQGEERTRSAIGHAFERIAPRLDEIFS